MKIFISYHLADSKYRFELENILKERNIDYYAVPENADFSNWHHQHISQVIIEELKKCDVTLCIIGKVTYSRPHVDHEIHATLEGKICDRRGIVGIMLENRCDNKNNIDFSTFPNRIQDNLKYTVLEQWATITKRIVFAIDLASSNRCDKSIQVDNSRDLMPLRSKHYYDN